MCLPQRELRLGGYQSGSISFFRGAELKHHVAPWEGDGEHGFGYAFDHTMHESVRRWCQGRRSDGGYQKPVLLEAEKNDRLKRAPISRKPPKIAKGKGKEKELPKRPRKEDKGWNRGSATTTGENALHPSLWTLRNHRLTQQSGPQNARLTTKTTQAKARPGTNARSDPLMVSYKE